MTFSTQVLTNNILAGNILAGKNLFLALNFSFCKFPILQMSFRSNADRTKVAAAIKLLVPYLKLKETYFGLKFALKYNF